jgi:hypothetical protein
MLPRAALALLLALAPACRTYDPQVFDERLRAATFDAYWEELDRHYPYFALKQPRPNAYTGRVVVLVNAETASAAEWMACVLQLERGAVLVGERTAGADAGVEHRTGPDGSVLSYGRWPLTGRDGKDFQGVGIEPDVAVPLTLDSVEQHGYMRAQFMVREERLRRALGILGAEDRFEALREEACSGGGALWENGRGRLPADGAVQGD